MRRVLAFAPLSAMFACGMFDSANYVEASPTTSADASLEADAPGPDGSDGGASSAVVDAAARARRVFVTRQAHRC